MCGLSHVRPAWFDAIIGTNGNIEFLLRIAVEISDEKTAAPILVNEPAFKGSGHTRAELLARLGDLLTQQQCAAGDGTGGAQDEDAVDANFRRSLRSRLSAYATRCAP